jgi:myo-inositol-1(or 4)-monophosphatase
VNDEELIDAEHLAMDLAVEAGQFIVTRRPDVLSASTKSTPTDVVTTMDRASEALLARRLVQVRPDDGFYGEEQSRRESVSGFTWVVDPIDGTVNYLYNIPVYAVSVALVTGDPSRPGDWQSVAGAVYEPMTGQLFHARAGGPAAVRYVGHRVSPDEVLHVRPDVPIGQALVATGFGYESEVRAIQARVLTNVLPAVRDIRRAGSAALDMCAVAAGRLDGYYESGLNPWDAAAGLLILRQAGGVASGWHGREELDPGVVAGSPGVQVALRAIIEEALSPTELVR